MARSNPRRTLAVAAVGAAVLGWLLSLGANRIAARYLALPDDAELARITPGEPPAPREPGEPSSEEPRRSLFDTRPPSRSDYVDPIVARSIFDSSKVGVVSAPMTDTGVSGRRSDLKVLLLATVVTEPPEYSSALFLEEKSKDKASGYGVGDDLIGEATIVRIEQRKVIIRRNDGTVEYIDMEQDDGLARTSRTSDDTEGDGDVDKLEDNKFVVERSVVDAALENPEALASQVRVVPHRGTDGEVDGYRLSGIRRSSLFDKLGIKNGDIVHTVNGRELNSTSSALDAYQSLQNERNFSFEITRRNKRQSMEYEIR